jgi:hypothetical protein
MKQVAVTIPIGEITDWNSFHDVFQRVLGFPAFYGRNMNAWIDCMTSLDLPSDGMTTIHVEPGGILILRIDNPFEFQRRCPEQYAALLECSAFVNFRRVEVGEPPVLALLLNGRCTPSDSRSET